MIEPAQLIAFVLHPGDAIPNNVLSKMQEKWGVCLYKGQAFLFDKTDYYESEMGENLYRSLISFDCLIDPNEITAFKKVSVELERELLRDVGGRSVNIDIGYMDVDKVVLPSYKQGPCKLYAGDGIWLDMLLTYSKGKFTATSWAFDDFKRGIYQKDLALVRERFKAKLKVWRRENCK